MKNLLFLLLPLSAGLSFWCVAELCQGAYLLAAGLHLGCGICGILLEYLLKDRGSYLPFTCAIALFIPGMGGFLCGLSAVLARRKTLDNLASEYIRHIDPDEYRDPFSLERGRFRPDPEALQPLADILHSAAPLSRKRTAIEALAQMQSPGAVAVLRDALRMDSVEVRFFAASVLSRLENSLVQKLRELDREKQSKDHTVLMNMAQTYYDYAFYEIAEGSRRISCLQTALDKSKLALELHRTPQTLAMAGKILLELGRADEAIQCFDEYIKIRPAESTGYIWRAQARLSARLYAQASDDCRKILELGTVPVKIAEAVKFWAGELQA